MLSIHKDVLYALENHQPVVALESTIISHGMPYPENLTMAREVEQIIRAQGAVPATIAVMNGELKVGLTEEELSTLAQAPNVLKLSKRDLAYALAHPEVIGATTVSATLVIAQMADIKVFATGGLGGVHRGGEDSLDISRDLHELASTNVAVVCAGVKAILDIERTLEVIETLGVEVIGYGTDVMPGFYTARTPYPIDYRLDDVTSIARVMQKKWRNRLQGGILVVNPITEDYSLPHETIEAIIQDALHEAKKNQIKGKAVTPYLLQKIVEKTEGRSLEANIALVKNNALVAALIAKAYREPS